MDSVLDVVRKEAEGCDCLQVGNDAFGFVSLMARSFDALI